MNLAVSMFSGFASSKQEQHYDKTVEYAFELLCYKLLEQHKIINSFEKFTQVPSHKHTLWVTKFFKVFKALLKMEKHKKTEPKLFPLLTGLVVFLRKQEAPDGLDADESMVLNPFQSVKTEYKDNQKESTDTFAENKQENQKETSFELKSLDTKKDDKKALHSVDTAEQHLSLILA